MASGVPSAPSIITGTPSEPLVNVAEFTTTYANCVNSSSTTSTTTATTTAFSPPAAFSQDRARFDAVAARCNIQDEIDMSNAPFSDSTLFGWLKEWHDFLVAKAHPHQEREEATRRAKGIRPSWSLSLHDHPVEGGLDGAISGSHPIGGGIENAREGREEATMEEEIEADDDQTSIAFREGSSSASMNRRPLEKRPMATRIFFNTTGGWAGIQQDLVAEAGLSRSQTTGPSTAGNRALDGSTNAADSSRPSRVPPASKVKIINEQTMQRLQRYLTPAPGEDTEDQSGFLKTATEVNIEKILQGIVSSPLAIMNVDHRFEVPTPERPPLNFRNIFMQSSRPPFRAITDTEEVVLTVGIQSNAHPSRRLQELKLLGSNTLMDLRNALTCPSDFVLQGHDEPPEGHVPQNTATRKTSSSMFCIESRFYIDNPYLHAKADKKRALVEQEQDRQIKLRHQIFLRRRDAEKARQERLLGSATDNAENMAPLDLDVSDLENELKNVPPELHLPMEEMELENEEELKEISEDYSIPVIDWANLSLDTLPLGAVPSKRIMAETTLRSLNVRLHHPYLFVHQGFCEHVVYFLDVRVINFRHDNLNKNEYPITTFLSRTLRHRCRMCPTNGADYITLDDILADTNPCYFCERCFNSYHYDAEGKPLFSDSMRVFRHRFDLKEEVTSSAHQGELHLAAN